MKKALVLLGFVAACGDNVHPNGTPDAHEIKDAHADAPLDAFLECNYTEQHDLTNDYFADPTAIEETDVHFTGGGPRTICGTINSDHFDAVAGTVDIDNYGLTIDKDSDVIVRLTGNAQNILTVGVFGVTDTGGFAGGDYYLGNHAVFSQHLAAGHYQFSVEATDAVAAVAPVDYKVRISVDDPTDRCKDVSAAANYTEANDGATNAGNDMISVDYNNTPPNNFVFTATLLDNPEPTTLVLDAGNYRLSGTSASVAGQGSYYDRDTYLITTGATTNEIAVRLNPGSTAADMDFYLFQENRAFGLSFGGAQTGLGDEEFATLAVNPNSRYWLWIGKAIGADAGASDNVASMYDASVCASTFTE